MKKLILQTVFIYVFLMPIKSVNAQVSTPANAGTAADYVGWNAAQAFPLRIEHKGNNYIDSYTNGFPRTRVTTGNLLVPTGGVTAGGPGDGLRIFPKIQGCSNSTAASIDLWTSCSNGTNIRWGESGQISGANNQLQQWANFNGFWFNTYGATGRYIFNTLGTEQARVGLNRFWRIGDNPSNNDAVRRLEVFDNSSLPQLRLTANPASATFVDFKSRSNGTLNIIPSGNRVSINNNVNPTHTLEINGDLRVRNIPVATPNCLLVGTNQTGTADNQISRLDFTGNASQVLLGNGTWGNAAASLFANNGATIANILGQDYVQWGQTNSGNGSLNGGELLHDTEIPFNGFNVFFQDPAVSATGINRMQIGTYLGSVQYNSFAKLSTIHAENNPSAPRIAGFYSTTAAFNIASVPLSFRPGFINSSTTFHAGILSIASDLINSSNNLIGVEANAFGANSATNVGLNAKAYGSPTLNYGIFTRAGDAGSATNYGIYANASGGTINWAGWFEGDVNVNGDYYQNGALFTSDQNLKVNIANITNATNIVNQLEPKEFYFDTNNTHGMSFSNQKQYGLIAQEVETILPELVGSNTIPPVYDSLGNIISPAYTYKTLNYNAFIGILLQAQKENNQIINNQDSLINSLQDQINTLYSMITTCCSNNSNTQNNSLQQNPINTLDITLSDNVPSIVLDQNVPNPFAEQTTITYTLTEGVKKAQMLFYNIEGKLIQSVDLSTTSGKGQMNVFANDLSTGVYTYTLVVDGEIKGTKRMVKE